MKGGITHGGTRGKCSGAGTPTAGQWVLPSQQSGLGGQGEGSRDEAAVLQAKARTSHLCSLEEKARQANGER